MKKLLLLPITLLLLNFTFAQAPDFTFTDTHGNEHTLYESLDAGKTVLLDFFFVDCPPCQTWSPVIEEVYQQFGAGNLDVEFWGFSDRDADSYIEGFKDEYGVTFPGGGIEGGADNVIDLYAANYSFVGFPTYSVICPDRSISWDIWPLTSGAPEVQAALEACGASVPTGVAEVSSLTSQIRLFPNPAQNYTNIEFTMESSANVTIAVYNVLGAQVGVLADSFFPTGKHALNIDLGNFATGNYFIRLMGDNNQADVVKVSIVK